MAKPNITLERLREFLEYDPATGEFFWLKSKSPRARVGSRAGSTYQNGYRVICIDFKDYGAHRLAWFFINGEWPKQHIDHMNGIRSDNRIENLRDVSPHLNMQNQRRPHADKKSCQLLGASWDKMWSNWKATLTINKKTINLGRFKTPEEAHAAYLDGKRKYHDGYLA